MGTSKDRFGRFVRAAVVSGLLGAAGLIAVAGPVRAQASDPSDAPGAPSDPSDPSDAPPTTQPGDTTGGGGLSGDVGGGGSGISTGSGSLASTGANSEMMLLFGAGAGGAAVVLRRVARRA